PRQGRAFEGAWQHSCSLWHDTFDKQPIDWDLRCGFPFNSCSYYERKRTIRPAIDPYVSGSTRNNGIISYESVRLFRSGERNLLGAIYHPSGTASDSHPAGSPPALRYQVSCVRVSF